MRILERAVQARALLTVEGGPSSAGQSTHCPDIVDSSPVMPYCPIAHASNGPPNWTFGRSTTALHEFSNYDQTFVSDVAREHGHKIKLA